MLNVNQLEIGCVLERYKPTSLCIIVNIYEPATNPFNRDHQMQSFDVVWSRETNKLIFGEELNLQPLNIYTSSYDLWTIRYDLGIIELAYLLNL